MVYDSFEDACKSKSALDKHLVDLRRQKKGRAAGNRCAPMDCGIELVDIW